MASTATDYYYSDSYTTATTTCGGTYTYDTASDISFGYTTAATTCSGTYTYTVDSTTGSNVIYIDSTGWETDTWIYTPISVFNIEHYREMQCKINKAWELWCRQEKLYIRNQEKLERAWDSYLHLEKQREKTMAREAAEEKAIQLLESLIGKEIDVYRKTGRVFVKGRKADYIVKKGGGITKIEKKKVVDFCVHIKSSFKCPPTDHVIALKMMLEEDDKKVLKIANRRTTRTIDELPLAACM